MLADAEATYKPSLVYCTLPDSTLFVSALYNNTVKLYDIITDIYIETYNISNISKILFNLIGLYLYIDIGHIDIPIRSTLCAIPLILATENLYRQDYGIC